MAGQGGQGWADENEKEGGGGAGRGRGVLSCIFGAFDLWSGREGARVRASPTGSFVTDIGVKKLARHVFCQ